MIILPIGDVSSRKTRPVWTVVLMLVNIGVFAWMVTRPDPIQVVERHALVPAQWQIQTVFTSMFLHGGWLHLLGNMLFLWVVGRAVEDRLGHSSFLLFYLACGIAGSIAHILTLTPPLDLIPCVGASGAISGVIGAYLILFPGGKIEMLFFFIIAKKFVMPSWIAIGAWIATQLLMARNQMEGRTTEVAVFAHLGGLAFGLGVAILLRMVDAAKALQKKL